MLGVAVAVFGAIAVAAQIPLWYSQAAVLFGVIAGLSAPVVIHKVADRNWSLIFLVVLSQFAIFPVRKLFQLDGLLDRFLLTLAYLLLLWTVGFGWRRTWQ